MQYVYATSNPFVFGKSFFVAQTFVCAISLAYDFFRFVSRPHRGRKPSVDTAEIKRLRDEEKLGATEIARRLGIGRATVYRALASGGQET